MFSCTKESPLPKLTFHESLELLVYQSGKVRIINDNENLNLISNSRQNFNNEEYAINSISFEILDNSVILEIEKLFIDYNNYNAFLEFRNSIPSNSRIKSCRKIWTYYGFSDGCEAMEVCSDCSGGWECNLYIWCNLE